jgi:hypothetical protein
MQELMARIQLPQMAVLLAQILAVVVVDQVIIMVLV